MMPDDSQIEALLDLWDELRERGEQLTGDEFVREYCAGLTPETLEILQQKIAAIESIDRYVADALDVSEADAETQMPEDMDNQILPQLQPGAEPIAGYRLVSRLGQGGFGEVWKARGPGGFHVALKFVRLDHAASESELRSLELLKRLRHPNLITTIGSWLRDGWLVIASELVGQSLQDRLDALLIQGKTGLPRAKLLSYMRDAAKAIDYLNQPRHPLGDGRKGGIQHRDIKPGNLLLSGGGLKVADLGIARLLAGAVTDHTGAMSVAYAAPEFFAGETSDRSDQYSLAVTYCYLRGGRLPFQGSHFLLMKGHLESEPDLSMIPPEERPAVSKALAKLPQDRWRSCGEFVAALKKSKSAAVKGGMESPAPPQSRNADRNWTITGIAALGLVSFALIWFGVQFLNDGTPAEPQASKATQASIDSTSIPDTETKGEGAVQISLADSVPHYNDHLVGRPTSSTPEIEEPKVPSKFRNLTPSGQGSSELSSTDNSRFVKIRDFIGHSQAVRSVAFSPDGKYSLSGGLDLVLRLWDVEQGTEVRSFQGHTGTVHRVAFFPDGRTAVSSSYDQTVRIWNLESGEELQQWKAEGDVRDLTVVPADNRIACSVQFEPFSRAIA